MPQLDIATFLPQVFWLVLVFVIFYVLVLQYILPKLSTILKVRAKKLNEGGHILGEMSSENIELGKVYDKILTNSLKESERLLQLSNNGAFSWVESTSKKRISNLNKINSFYLTTIGKLSAKRGILRTIFIK